jgi:hypothetical protein
MLRRSGWPAPKRQRFQANFGVAIAARLNLTHGPEYSIETSNLFGY